MMSRNAAGVAAALSLSLLIAGSAAHAEDAPGPKALARLTVANDLDMARSDEVIDLPLKDVLAHTKGAAPETLAVRDAGDGVALVTQLIDESGGGAPDHLLILADLAPKQKRTLELFTAAAPTAPETRVFGRAVPERKDDFAWENDRIAFRMYGPALQIKKHEVDSGVDVLCKRVPQMVLNEWYHREEESEKVGREDIHKDVGQGLDCYQLEPLRGCGGTAVWSDDQLVASQNYVTAKILASGPIRFVFELTYAPWDAAGVSVSEVKRISLDAGSRLNRMQSTFHFDSKDPITVAAALALHKGADLHAPVGPGPIAVWEPADRDPSFIGTGMIVPPGSDSGVVFKQAARHAMFLFPVKSDQPIVYYAGAGWSRSDIPDQATWDRYLADFEARLKSPLKVQWAR